MWEVLCTEHPPVEGAGCKTRLDRRVKTLAPIVCMMQDAQFGLLTSVFLWVYGTVHRPAEFPTAP